MNKTEDIQELSITVTNETSSFTEQLGEIIAKINEGYTSGYGWNIQAAEANENTISVTWSVEDVKEIAKDLTDDECREVLQLAKENHDATIGINWDVLTIWADEVRDSRKS